MNSLYAQTSILTFNLHFESVYVVHNAKINKNIKSFKDGYTIHKILSIEAPHWK